MLVNDPRSNMVMFRRTNPQIKGAGGIFETGCGIYNQLPAHMRPKIKTGDMEVTFPRRDDQGKTHYDGAKIKYQQAENVEQSKLNMQGLQYTFIGMDEGTQFCMSQIEYAMSRLRSQSSHFSRMVISCNPDPDHALRQMIDWYLAEDGYPIPERDGVVRYFIQRDGSYIWGDTREDLGARYDIPECEWEGKILSFSFVSGTIYDNPPMMKNNPSYLAFLEGLNEVDKAQLLHGNWNARAKGASYFQREWLHEVDKVPFDEVCGRGYDFAATERSQVNKNPDATASVKMYRSKDGYYTITGEYHRDFTDRELNVDGRMLERVGTRNKVMIKQAEYDGVECHVVAPQDPGAAGKQAFTEMAKMFRDEGFIFKKDPCPINKSKLVKFLPFAAAAENGLVRIVRSTFSDKTYEYLMKELEAFDGERSTTTRKDDFCDSLSSVFNYLCQAKVRQTFVLPTGHNNNTMLHKHKQQIR